MSKENWYRELCSTRDRIRKRYNEAIKENLVDASQKDQATHLYFKNLLANDNISATSRFKDIYTSFKKLSVTSSIDLDVSFLLDVTGSMAPYARAMASSINSILVGTDSIAENLKITFPDIDFHLRVGIAGCRDFVDKSKLETVWQGNAIKWVESITKNPSGGGDIAEAHLGAIDSCAKWISEGDWTSPIKFIPLLTDAPAHGTMPTVSKRVADVDNYMQCGILTA